MTATTITAGLYLRKRRQAAGLSIEEVAAGCMLPATRDKFAARLTEIENDTDVAAAATLAVLHDCFRFDVRIYTNLAAGLPADAAICRNCACSWGDACVGRTMNCHWAEPDLCSRCASGIKHPTGPTEEPVFKLTARDPHAVPMLTILSCMRVGAWKEARRVLDEAIRDDQTRSRNRPLVDEKGSREAAATALDMLHFRDVADALSPVGIFHV